jgi:transcriptional repressor NrdR
VAYVRFASVYQDFQDVEAFRRHIEQMQQRENKHKLEKSCLI